MRISLKNMGVKLVKTYFGEDVPKTAMCTPIENRGMIFTDDKGKEYRFEQEGLNIWRSHFDGWLALKAKESGAEVRDGVAALSFQTFNEGSIDLDPHYFYAYLQPELSEYDAWFNVKDDLLVLGVSVKDMDKISHYYECFIAYMEEKHHLRIGRQTKSERWLMPHIRPGCRVDYGVGRVLFAGETAGFLNPMGEGISAGMESGHIQGNGIIETESAYSNKSLYKHK